MAQKNIERLELTPPTLEEVEAQAQPAVEIITKYVCPTCQELHATEYRAEECCPKEIEEAYVCAECKEDFDDFSDAQKHVKTHGIPRGELQEMYFDHLVIEAKPTLGQWAFELEQKNEAA